MADLKATVATDLIILAAILAGTLYILDALSNSVTGGLATSVSDAVENSATGQLSESETNTLVAQEESELIAAGMPPPQALAQAKSDVAKVEGSQPGFFGFLWQEVKDAL